MTEAYCEKHEDVLLETVTTYKGILVYPCPTCLEEAGSEEWDTGYAQGLEEGRAESDNS